MNRSFIYSSFHDDNNTKKPFSQFFYQKYLTKSL
nr:MAG TPA: hypothetical protein [Caudoviricetes sp.]